MAKTAWGRRGAWEPEGVAGLETSEQKKTAVKDDGEPEQHKDLLQSPSAPGKSLHPPQRVRSVATALGIQPPGPRF